MNGFPMNLILTPILVAFGVGLIVLAARHKAWAGNVRGLSIAAGASLFVIGMLNSSFSANRPGSGDSIGVGIVIVSAAIGAFVGYWLGHNSHPRTTR